MGTDECSEPSNLPRPKVLCLNALPTVNGAVVCEREMGHLGRHRVKIGKARVSWHNDMEDVGDGEASG